MTRRKAQDFPTVKQYIQYPCPLIKYAPWQSALRKCLLRPILRRSGAYSSEARLCPCRGQEHTDLLRTDRFLLSAHKTQADKCPCTLHKPQRLCPNQRVCRCQYFYRQYTLTVTCNNFYCANHFNVFCLILSIAGERARNKTVLPAAWIKFCRMVPAAVVRAPAGGIPLTAIPMMNSATP